MFWLTGSQQYKVMKNIRDTLAGRIGILEPVSYTHLDVYKRQELYELVREKDYFVLTTNVDPVSYTHLDVYKRQLQICSSGRW